MSLGPIMTDVSGVVLTDEDRELLEHPAIGGVILFSRNYVDDQQLRDLVGSVAALRTPSLLIAIDQEGGRVQRFADGFTRLPPLRWFGQQFNLDPAAARSLAHKAAWIMAVELLEFGIDFSFAPVVDIDWGLSEVIGDRAFHADPEVVSSLALSYTQGMRAAGMASVAKHFPGHGGVAADSHVSLPEDHRPYTDLIEDLKPYQCLIDHGLQGIMPAHVRYTEVDQQIASMSEYWLRTELRENLGYKGAVFSDDLSMAGAGVVGEVPERVVTTIKAGSDMVLICNDRDAVVATLDATEGLHQPTSQARLIAMRPAGEAKDASLVGTSAWQNAVDELRAAIDRPPPLTLDG
ncbi:MAG: beta-N-acetylhexosaminidase [Gammaproteobacteria bacterium]|nr:beta-N-acetylhexosaminidase [Gammaproteobacteria bacterium]